MNNKRVTYISYDGPFTINSTGFACSETSYLVNQFSFTENINDSAYVLRNKRFDSNVEQLNNAKPLDK